MTAYTREEYCEKYKIHRNTLSKRIKDGTLPSFHVVKRIDERGAIVIIVDHCAMCEMIESAAIEYWRKTKLKNPALAAELSIKYKLNTAQLFRILGL